MMASDELSKYQSKSITPVDHYVCTLSEATKKRAFDEFGETEELRQKSIKEVRDWVLNNKRIIATRLDARYILRYLRHHNYDMDCVKESIERSLIFREGLYGYDWLTDLDFERPNLQELLDAGIMVILPDRLPTGERVIVAKFAACSTKMENSANSALCLTTQILEILLDDEENQVNGFHYIFDISGVTLRHYFLLSFPTWFKILKNCERTYSGRHRGGHIINMPSTIAFVARLAFSHMHQKMRDGIKFYSNLDDLKIVSKEELPEIFGGNAPLKPLTAEWTEKLKKWRPFLLNYKNQGIDKECYKPAVLNCEVKTLAHRLENPKAKLLTNYD